MEGRVEKAFYANRDKEAGMCKNSHKCRRGKEKTQVQTLAGRKCVRSLCVYAPLTPIALLMLFFGFGFWGFFFSWCWFSWLCFLVQCVETSLFWKIIPWPITCRSKRVSSNDLWNKVKQTCPNRYLALVLLRKILPAFISFLFFLMEYRLLLLSSLSCNTTLHSAPVHIVP